MAKNDNPTQMSVKTKRLFSIDLLRATAIFGMILTHFVGFISDPAVLPYQIIIIKISYYFGSFLSVPLFLYCSGFSMAFASIKKGNKREWGSIVKGNVLKGLFLTLIGIVYTILIHGVEKITYFWILQCIGVLMMLGAVLYNKTKVTLSITLLAFGSVIYFQMIPTIYTIRVNNITDFEIIKLLITVFISGNFALIPWCIFFLIGILCGIFYSENKQNVYMPIFIGVILLLLSLLLINLKTLTLGLHTIPMNITKYPVSISYILFFSGVILMLMPVLYIIFDINQTHLFFQTTICRLSSLSLTIFCVHYAWGLVFLLKGVSKFTSEPLVAILFTLFFVFIMDVIAKYWQKIQYRYSLEYFLKLISTIKP